MQERLKELEKTSLQQLETERCLFLDTMEEWLNVVMATQVRSNTLDEYKRAFAYRVKPYPKFQNLPLQELTPRILQEYYNDLVKSGLSPNTVHKQHTNIGKFLKYAVRLDMIKYSPADRVVLPKKVKSTAAKFYTTEQLQQLLTLFWGEPLEHVVFLTAHLGLRRSEVCGLRWENIDFKSARILIRHTAIVINGQLNYTDNTKSQSSRRVLPMSRAVMEYLERVRKGQADKKNDLETHTMIQGMSVQRMTARQSTPIL